MITAKQKKSNDLVSSDGISMFCYIKIYINIYFNMYIYETICLAVMEF